MLKDLRDIRAKELKGKIEKYNRVCTALSEIEKTEKEYDEQPKVEPREFTFWEKVFKTREYEEYLKQVQQDRKLLKRYQQIKLKEKKAELQKEMDVLDIDNLKKLYEKVSFAQTLEDLDLNIDEAKTILQENNKDLILDSSDKTPINRQYIPVKKLSDYVLICKLSYAPNSGKIETPKTIGDTEKSTLVINGEAYDYEYEKELDIISFTINDEKMYKTEKESLEKKYAVIINLNDVAKDKIKVLSPVNTLIDGDLEIPEGSYIICPKVEQSEISKQNPNINVIGYVGVDVNGFARSYISMLEYRIEKLDIWSWVNPLAQEDFMNLTFEKGFNTDNQVVNLVGNEHIKLNINKYISIMNVIKDNKLLKNNEIVDILNELIKKDMLQLTQVEIILKELLAEQYKGLMQLYDKLKENKYEIKEEYQEIISNVITIPAYEKITEEMVLGFEFKEKASNKEFAKFLKQELKQYDEKINLPYQLVGIIITYLVLEIIKNK